MNRICVYCGSSGGRQPLYAEAARALGATLAERKLGLVYGGASIGVMGAVAEAVLAAGGEAIGVIPTVLMRKEVAHQSLTELREVATMHERKALMVELADGFMALPGGFGTLDELFEILTWAQLGMHQKPCGILNVGGYFDHLITFMRHSVAEEFVREPQLQALLIDDDPARLLDRFADYRPMPVKRWIAADDL